MTIKNMSPQLLVSNIAHSIEFYTNKLGFSLAFLYDDFYAGISKDGHTFHLKSGKPNIEERNNKQENNDLDIIFSVEGIDQLYEGFVSKDINIIQPLCNQPYGREFYITDPDGYVLAFLQEV